ncbi:MAG TPA: nucleotidyltransferase domain-containing protein [Chitinophagales bacterium]|jgi:predicted nucleotidyltransferase|nr:nucleotidyltransferase domain-containing protein [Chitinophagales bacterium]MBP6155204.1 nucleotidyltransferase domain-containing protein [Chitinophagales bacterium]HQV78001.1 nucleotidyltransferase domain-containing protein [Chitinophagales bacterium]HQW78723.1 nucleotidyltransferase domain-containing protein [Chitinophagales bacterium]
MQPQTIEDIRNYFIEHDLFNKYNLTKIGVFGSFARGEKFKDIDLYIEDDIELRKAAELKILLQNYYDLQIDLVLKSKENKLIMFYAKKNMKYIYAN